MDGKIHLLSNVWTFSSIHRNMRWRPVDKSRRVVSLSLLNFSERDLFWCFLESSSIRSDDAYAKDRVKSARLKLNGVNPAVITG